MQIAIIEEKDIVEIFGYKVAEKLKSNPDILYEKNNGSAYYCRRD